jgi:hypothetical protein
MVKAKDFELGTAFWLAKPNHPVGVLCRGARENEELCRIWWHSLQSVIRLVSASLPRALRRFT